MTKPMTDEERALIRSELKRMSDNDLAKKRKPYGSWFGGMRNVWACRFIQEEWDRRREIAREIKKRVRQAYREMTDDELIALADGIDENYPRRISIGLTVAETEAAIAELKRRAARFTKAIHLLNEQRLHLCESGEPSGVEEVTRHEMKLIRE